MDRRTFLSTLLLNARQRTPEANERLLEAVWRGARDRFYDPGMRGVNWDAVRTEFLPKARACSTNEQLAGVLRDMLSRLRNSHIFLYSRQEWDWRKNMLPFLFDRVGQRVFVRYVPKTTEDPRPGDEVASVDGLPAKALRPVTLARLEPVLDNPYFGPANSEATLRVCRKGRTFESRAKRIARARELKAVISERPRSGVVHLRFFALDSISVPLPELRRVWEAVPPSKGLILDLRDCFGGDDAVASYIASSLLGPGKSLFRNVPRPGGENKEPATSTGSNAPRYEGPVALITNRSTESEPEILAAILKEYGRAKLFGERTAGAVHGWTVAIETPENWLRYAIPYTKSISPKGIDYEGKGIDPDKRVANAVADHRAGTDKPLEAALDYLETKKSR